MAEKTAAKKTAPKYTAAVGNLRGPKGKIEAGTTVGVKDLMPGTNVDALVLCGALIPE